jgi:hypothetical protein
LLPSSEWTTLIVGVISKNLNLESRDQDIRRQACDRLAWELNFASHLGKHLAYFNLPIIFLTSLFQTKIFKKMSTLIFAFASMVLCMPNEVIIFKLQFVSSNNMSSYEGVDFI